MTCPKCGGKIRVLDTVHNPDNETYRRKRCTVCSHEFFTTEFEIEVTDEFKREWSIYGRWRPNQPREYLPDSVRKYQRYPEEVLQYMRDHCYESPYDIAKRFGMNLGTAKRYIYGYRSEKRAEEKVDG